jgi:hypothetical protein
MNDLGLHVMKSETWIDPAFQAFDAARLDDDIAFAVDPCDEPLTAEEAAEDSACHLHLEFASSPNIAASTVRRNWQRPSPTNKRWCQSFELWK